MTWVKIDDTLPGNLKVMSVPVAARWTYVASICYASANKTDGKIPRPALPGLSGNPGTAAKLVEAGLWEPLPDGWLIHDYLKHNRSRDKIEQVSEGARKAGLARHGVSETHYLLLVLLPVIPYLPLRIWISSSRYSETLANRWTNRLRSAAEAGRKRPGQR